MKRDELVAYLDDYLQLDAFQDSSDNGLQVEGAAEVQRLAFAVDAGLAAFEEARAAQAQMLIVHHGLFWGKPVRVTGIHRRRLKTLLDADISLYAAHLPLDSHATVGHSATLARWLALEETAPFGEYKGLAVGVAGRLPRPRSLTDLVAAVEDLLGRPVVAVWPFGPDEVRRVGIVSGGGASLVEQAAKAGVDVYLTGEVGHSYYHQARELGQNVIFAGHYATETVGLKALAEHLSSRFGLESRFLDLPTGA